MVSAIVGKNGSGKSSILDIVYRVLNNLSAILCTNLNTETYHAFYFSEDEKERMNDYIRRYRPQLRFDDENHQFSLESDDDFKNLMFGIDQRYYTTEISNEQRIAHSVTSIDNQ